MRQVLARKLAENGFWRRLSNTREYVAICVDMDSASTGKKRGRSQAEEGLHSKRNAAFQRMCYICCSILVVIISGELSARDEMHRNK